MSSINSPKRRGVKHGVVQDKLWLPGLLKLRALREQRFLRPDIFGSRRIRLLGVRRGNHTGATSILELPQAGRRRNHHGHVVLTGVMYWTICLARCGRFPAWARRTFPGVGMKPAGRMKLRRKTPPMRDFNWRAASWRISTHHGDVRVRRDDLLTIQVDGTKGSAVAGLRDCWIQPGGPDAAAGMESGCARIRTIILTTGKRKAPVRMFDNAFKSQWELFLRHVVTGEPFRWNLLEGAKGVQLAEMGLESWRKRAWMEVPPLEDNSTSTNDATSTVATSIGRMATV